MGKILAKRLVAAFVRCLPPRARKGLLAELCVAARGSDAYATLQRLGRRFGIAGVRVSGDYGIVDGALADTAILATYARTQCWVPGINAAIDAFFGGYDGGTYIDIGANIGLTSIPIARWPRVACKAFEPEPQTFQYLTANLAQNGPATNVEAFNFALSDRNSTIAFELSDDNLGDHRIRLNAANGSFGESGRRVIEVPTKRLDDVLRVEELSRPIAIRLSTQGAECRVLEGGQAVFDAASLFTFEFWPYGIARMGDDARRLIAFIARRYSSGAILEGKQDDHPTWKPIGDIAERLSNFASSNGDRPYALCDVIAMREPAWTRPVVRDAKGNAASAATCTAMDRSRREPHSELVE